MHLTSPVIALPRTCDPRKVLTALTLVSQHFKLIWSLCSDMSDVAVNIVRLTHRRVLHYKQKFALWSPRQLALFPCKYVSSEPYELSSISSLHHVIITLLTDCVSRLLLGVMMWLCFYYLKATGPRPPALANLKIDVEDVGEAEKPEASQSFLRKYVRPLLCLILTPRHHFSRHLALVAVVHRAADGPLHALRRCGASSRGRCRGRSSGGWVGGSPCSRSFQVEFLASYR